MELHGQLAPSGTQDSEAHNGQNVKWLFINCSVYKNYSPCLFSYFIASMNGIWLSKQQNY